MPKLSLEKSKNLIQLSIEKPKLSIEKLGKEFGISTSNAAKILKQEKIKRSRY